MASGTHLLNLLRETMRNELNLPPKRTPDILGAIAFSAGALILAFAVFMMVRSDTPDPTVNLLPRLSPSGLSYSNAGSGVPQVVELVLWNETTLPVSNVQVIPSCGCVVDDFGVVDIPPGNRCSGKLTLRNDSNDVRISTILIQYQINGSPIDELVTITPQNQRTGE